MWVIVDMGYYTFYRYHACKKWWSFKKEKEQKEPYQKEEEFKSKLLEKFEHYLNVIRKKVPDNSHFVLAFDASDGKNWRKDFYPDYKSQRPLNKDVFLLMNDVFESFIPEYKSKNPGIIIMKEEGKEADDLVARKVRSIRKNSKDEISIIASDQDYLQLIEPESNIHLRDMNFKNLSENKPVLGKNYLIQKIIYGDKSDNIIPMFKGRNSGNKKKELYENMIKNDLADIKLSYFENKEDYEKFKFNKKLVEL